MSLVAAYEAEFKCLPYYCVLVTGTPSDELEDHVPILQQVPAARIIRGDVRYDETRT